MLALISSKITALCFDSRYNKTLYVEKNSPDTIKVIDHKNKMSDFLTIEGAQIEKLSFDSTTNNIYYVDATNGMCICGMTTRKCTILIQKKTDFDKNSHFSSLAIDSQRGVIHYTQKTKLQLQVKMASMDGTNVRTLFSMNAGKGLKLYPELGQLYLRQDPAEINKYYMSNRSPSTTVFDLDYKFHLQCNAQWMEEHYFKFKVGMPALSAQKGSYIQDWTSVQNVVMTTNNWSQRLSNQCKRLKCMDICVTIETHHRPNVKCICATDECESASDKKTTKEPKKTEPQKKEPKKKDVKKPPKVRILIKEKTNSLNVFFVLLSISLALVLIIVICCISSKCRLCVRNRFASLFKKQTPAISTETPAFHKK
ncbi:hypothetical protein M3Y97_00916200 [Aphelenchoides bicaudatus]|nr:hypothetical protein M3Y97_00916200 [Aphelenchoides bicaudatus]